MRLAKRSKSSSTTEPPLLAFVTRYADHFDTYYAKKLIYCQLLQTAMSKKVIQMPKSLFLTIEMMSV